MTSKTRSLIKREGIVRSRDLGTTGLTRSQISRMVAKGEIFRVGRGLYSLPEYKRSENASLVEVAKRSPGAVFCLLTALRIHELTTQAPFQLWVAIGNKSRPPRPGSSSLRVVRFSGSSLRAGVETRLMDKVPVQVTNVAKTVADCFKFRNKIGTDVAVEALREVLKSKKASIDELWRYAKIDHVANLMRPYIEAIT